MDFEVILNSYNYRDIDESDSESDDDRPDLLELCDSSLFSLIGSFTP